MVQLNDPFGRDGDRRSRITERVSMVDRWCVAIRHRRDHGHRWRGHVVMPFKFTTRRYADADDKVGRKVRTGTIFANTKAEAQRIVNKCDSDINKNAQVRYQTMVE